MATFSARVRLALALGGVVLLGATAAPASAQLPTTNDPRVGLSAGLTMPVSRSAASSCWPTGPSRPAGTTPARSASSTPTWRSRATTPSSAAGTASRSSTSPTRRRRCSRPPWCARAARVTSRCTGTCCSCPSRRRGRRRTASSRPAATTGDALPRRAHLRHLQHQRPQHVGGVQTCRGSHTHTLVEGKDDPNSVYIYVSGTSGHRSARPTTSRRATPARRRTRTRRSGGSRSSRCRSRARRHAAVVNEPRLFQNEQTGAVNGLQNAPSTPQHPCASVTPPACDATTNPATNGAAGSRCRTRTPATTSRSSSRPTSRPARARATACCSTSQTRPTRVASTPSLTRCSPTGTAPRSPTTAATSSSPTSGAAARTRAAARPTS